MLLSVIHAGFALQSKSWQFTRGSHTMEKFRYVNCDFWDRRANLENEIKTPLSKLTILVSSCWEKNFIRNNAHNYRRANLENEIKTPLSKLTILVSSCWEKNFIRNNAHNFFILHSAYLVFLKLLIVSVAFFLGHPVYGIVQPAYIALKYLIIGPRLHPSDKMHSVVWNIDRKKNLDELNFIYFLNIFRPGADPRIVSREGGGALSLWADKQTNSS